MCNPPVKDVASHFLMAKVVTLYIDDRERAIIAHREVFGDLPVAVSRMTHGDYAVCCDGSILAVFERKSLEDLAASVKDGRYDNKNGLVDLRNRTACRLVYIIEGKPPKDPLARVGGIPWGHLESALDHIAIRDCFSVVATRDTLDTARRLVRFTRSMQTLVNSGEIDTAPDGTSALLNEKREVSDVDIVRSMWCKFRGIAAPTADIFMERFTLWDVVHGGVNLQGLKMPDGRAVSKRVVDSLRAVDAKMAIALLECIPGVSRKTATELLKKKSLKTLLGYGVNGIAMTTIGDRKFGDIRAERIIKYFRYGGGGAGASVNRAPPEPPPVVQPPPAPPTPTIHMPDVDEASAQAVFSLICPP